MSAPASAPSSDTSVHYTYRQCQEFKAAGKKLPKECTRFDGTDFVAKAVEDMKRNEEILAGLEDFLKKLKKLDKK